MMPSEVVFSNGIFWYSINLQSLPAPDEQVSSVAQLESGMEDWAFIGDQIYCLGRQTLCEEDTQLYRLRGSTWDIASSPMKSPSRGSLVWPLNSNHIFTIPNRCNLIHDPYYDALEDFDEGRYTQVYNLESKTWSHHSCHFLEFAVMSECIPHPAIVVDEKGQPQKLLYFSYKRGLFLFIDNDSYRFEKHPNFALSLDDSSKRLLIESMEAVMPLVSESMLYWFTLDFCLYGYDIIHKRWFKSPPLREEQLWECYDASRLPILVDLYNGQFLMMQHDRTVGKMEIVLLDVSKGQDNLSVSQRSTHTFSIDDSESLPSPWHGVAIVRENTYVATPEKSSKGEKSEDYKQPQPQLCTPVLKQKLTDVDSLKVEASELKIQQFLGKDLTGLGVTELRLLERQLNEGLLAIRDRKDELLIKQQEQLKRMVHQMDLDSDTTCDRWDTRTCDYGEDVEVIEHANKTLKIRWPVKQKEPETGFISSNSEDQSGSK